MYTALTGWSRMVMLAVVTIRMWKSQPAPWGSVFRDSIARVSVLTVAWAMWVILVLPLSFD
jgi:hypothetical protein